MMNVQLCSDLEKVIFQDIGKRGLSEFWTYGCLHEAATKILDCNKTLPGFVLTGFCCMNEKCETDGPIGTSVLNRTLRDLGFNSIILTDSCAANVVISASLENPVHIEDNPNNLPKDISFVISIERPSRTMKTRDYRTCRARDISHVTSPLDQLFQSIFRPEDKKPYLTIGVGDGGNEVGTGNVHDSIVKYVNLGEEIAADTICDVLVLAGVSNWGAIAIAASLAICCEDQEIAQKFIDFCGRQDEMLTNMLKYGSYDGISGLSTRSIDGMKFEEEHTMVNNEIIKIVKSKYGI